MEAINSPGGKNTPFIPFLSPKPLFSFALTYDMALHNTPKCEN